MTFSEKLRKLRKEKGLSQEELAGQLDVSRQAVSKWESEQGFPETEKLLMIGNLFGVSLDYLLKEDPAEGGAPAEGGYYASREAVLGYLLRKRRGARHIALGVAILILSLVFPISMDGSGRSTVLFFVGVAIGVAILILQGFAPKHYQEIEEQPLTFDPAFLRTFRTQNAQDRKRCGALIVLGVVLVLLSFGVGALNSGEEHPIVFAALPVLWAMATTLFILAGSALSAARIITDNEKYIVEHKREEQSERIYAAMFPLASMLYLALGLIWGAWHPGWLVFPVTALGCFAYNSLRDNR